MAITGTSFIGIFNISQRPLTELIPLSRFLSVIEAQYYIVRSHISGLITRPMQVIDPASLIHLTLETRAYDVLSAYPLRGFFRGAKGQEDTTWIANLGLLGKMTGAAAIVKNDMSMRENGTITIDTSLKALGVLGELSIFQSLFLLREIACHNSLVTDTARKASISLIFLCTQWSQIS